MGTGDNIRVQALEFEIVPAANTTYELVEAADLDFGNRAGFYIDDVVVTGN